MSEGMGECRTCGKHTSCIVNIDWNAVYVCDECCLRITKQTVAAIPGFIMPTLEQRSLDGLLDIGGDDGE